MEQAGCCAQIIEFIKVNSHNCGNSRAAATAGCLKLLRIAAPISPQHLFGFSSVNFAPSPVSMGVGFL